MHVSLIMPAAFATLSGAAAYDHRMAACLGALGHTVRVIELLGRFPDADGAAIDAAHNAWASLDADTIPVIDGLALPAFSGLAAALAPRGVTVLVHHPASLETGLPEATAARLHAAEALLFRAAPRLVVTSEQTADRIVSGFQADRERIAVVSPGIADLPRSPGGAGATCAILSAGALIPRKGHDVLLRALGRLFDLDWRLTILGDSSRDPVHARGLSALAEQLHIDAHVAFADDSDAATAEALWQGSDLFALASWHEGYGSTMAEALRRGLPVAVTNTGAAPTLIGPEAGVVCAPGDVEQLSKALRRLIFDRTLRRDMAEVAWQTGRGLPSWHDQAIRLVDVLAQ